MILAAPAWAGQQLPGFFMQATWLMHGHRSCERPARVDRVVVPVLNPFHHDPGENGGRGDVVAGKAMLPVNPAATLLHTRDP